MNEIKIETIRTRNEQTGEINYRHMIKVGDIMNGTIIEILGQTIYAETVEHLPHGETKITDTHGEITRWGSDTRGALMGNWNV
jgi:hypothetical protein